MSFDSGSAKELLKEDLENKKTFTAYREATCYLCKARIMVDEEFVFMGTYKKVGVDCLGELQEVLDRI